MRASRFSLAALFVVVIFCSFYVGRKLAPTAAPEVASAPISAQPKTSPHPAPVETDTPASRTASPAPMQDKSSRLDEIDRELGDLPTDSSQLSELAAKIKADRDRIANLRAQLSASQRELLNESLRANSSRLAQSQMDYQEEVVALQQELSDAKIAVFQQQRILDLTIGSTPDTPPLPDIRKELERRKGIEAALERRIAEILANERNSVESSNAEEQSRLREWSDHQAMIEEDYSAAVSDLANSRRDYQEMAEENASARKKAQDLKTEKDELMKGN